MKLFGCFWLLRIAISIVVGQPDLSDISSLSHNLKNYNVVPIDMWDQSHPADIHGPRYLSSTVSPIATTLPTTTLALPTTTTVTTTTTTELPTVLIDTETNNLNLVDGESNQIIQAATGWEAEQKVEEPAVEAAEVVEMFDGIPCLGPVPKITTTLPPCALLALRAMEKTSTTITTEVPTTTTSTVTFTTTMTTAPPPAVIVTVQQEVESVDQGVNSFEESAEEVPETTTTSKPKKVKKTKKHKKVTTTTTTKPEESESEEESVEEITATTMTAKPRKAKVMKKLRTTTTTTTKAPEDPEVEEEYAEEVVITTTVPPIKEKKKPIVITTESTASEYDDVAELEQIIEAAHSFLLRLNAKTTTDEPIQSQTIWQDSDAKIPSSIEPPLEETERPEVLSETESVPSESTTMASVDDQSDLTEVEEPIERVFNRRDDVLTTLLLQPAKITVRNPLPNRQVPSSRPKLASQSLLRWNPTPGQCPNETDRLDTNFCTELANQGRCSTNRVTRLFFCRQTCLCASKMRKLIIFDRRNSASTRANNK